MRRYTMKDVAKEANVACSTVSRYINKSGYVDSETGDRIAEVIQKLNYSIPSHEKASFLKKNVIVLSVTDIGNPYYSVLARHLQSMLYEKGYTMVLFDSKDGKLEQDAIKLADELNAKGLFVGTIHYNDITKKAIQNISIPTVVLNASADGDIDCVHVDGDTATYIATKHLLSLGHRHIAYAGGLPKTMIGMSRREGYLRAMRENGLSPGPQDVIEHGLSQEDGYEIGRFIAGLRNCPTAVCCANDIIALGLLAALQERGKRIPEDISVTGVDDIVFAQKFTPSLTTVTNNPRKFAEKGIQLMLSRIENGNEGDPVDLAVTHQLIMRASTAPPSKSS